MLSSLSSDMNFSGIEDGMVSVWHCSTKDGLQRTHAMEDVYITNIYFLFAVALLDHDNESSNVLAISHSRLFFHRTPIAAPSLSGLRDCP